MAHSMDETEWWEHFNGEENNNSAEDNPSFSALSSFDYSERPPPYLEIEEIPSSRWLSPSFARFEPDEISPGIPATAASPSVASPSYASELRKKPSSFSWSRFFSPPFRKERTIPRPWSSFLQQDEEFSEILKDIYRFTFEEIREATNDFEDRNIIERGDSKVTYRGLLQRHNKIVAVKLFTTETCGNSRNLDYFRNYMHVSSRLRHRNITGFLGYCLHEEKFMLIYEYEQNGSLHRLLFTEDKGETLLGWRIRYQICLEIANGLAYLHKERIIHRDIKPSNILLDADFVPKIQDFSLTKCMSEDVTELTTRIVGTNFYLDPEYLQTGRVTEKTDVYSYGCVILDIVSGKRSSARSTKFKDNYLVQLHKTLKKQGNLLQFVDRRLGNLLQFVDPRLGSAYYVEEALTLLKLSALCTRELSRLRPYIPTVVGVLEGKLNVDDLNHEELEFGDIGGIDFPSFNSEEIGDVVISDNDASTILKGIHRFTFKEITVATNNFDYGNIVGRGRRKLTYRGFLEPFNQIAVQVFHFSIHDRSYEINETYIVSRLHHQNIARFLGYCTQNQEFMLIYEYGQNGSLNRYLSEYGEGTLELDWKRRYNICLGIAKGLAYLHEETGMRIIHRDINPSNILLDKDFNPMITDFSGAMCMSTDMSLDTYGSLNYIDPEYLRTGIPTERVDVFSYGIVMLEILTEKRGIELFSYQLHGPLSKQGNLQFVDPRLGSTYSKTEALMLFQLSSLCTQIPSERRPTITTVVSILEGKHEAMELNHDQLQFDIPILCENKIDDMEASGQQKNNLYSSRWSQWYSPAGRKESDENNSTISWLRFLEQDEELSEILKGMHSFTLEEIRAATDDFDDRNVIGRVGCTKIMYRGVLPYHNQIAVKLFVSQDFICPNELRNETRLASRLHHRNITSFLGYCKHGDKFMLIYEYEQNESLYRILFCNGEIGETLLNWSGRYKICLEIAHGLAYLHKDSGMKIIHRDIKSSNILLDADLTPKIICFYSARFMSMTRRECVHGTIGYIDPEYYMGGKTSEKADTFSYGVVLLEIVSGERCSELTKRASLRQLHERLSKQGNLLEFVDPRLGSAYSEEEALTLLELSALCTKMPCESSRPSLPKVVSVLEGKLGLHELNYKQLQDDVIGGLDYPSLTEKEIGDVETNDDACKTPAMSENIMIPSKENVMPENIEPMVQSNKTQICQHEFELKGIFISPSSTTLVDSYSLKLPDHYMPLTRKATQESSPSLTFALESIENNEDSSYNGKSVLDDDFDHLHVASGDPLCNVDDIDTFFSVIAAIRIPEEPDGIGEATEVFTAFDELKNLVLRNNLKEARDEETKSRILHLCEILDGFDLSEALSGLVHRVKGVLAVASEFSGTEEDSLYKKTYESAKLKIEETKDKAKKLHDEATTLRASKTSAENDIDNIMNRKAKLHEELAKLDEQLSAVKMRQVHNEKKLVEIRKVLASDTLEITQLVQFPDTADKRIKNNKECVEKAQEDWKQIQVGLFH